MQARKVLVVDDSKSIHKMFEVLIGRYSLIHARGGLEALQALGNHMDIDLILLDMDLPQMSGLELLRRIKSDAACKGIPVILVAGEGQAEITTRGLEAGAAAYIKKPFGTQELLDAIRRL